MGDLRFLVLTACVALSIFGQISGQDGSAETEMGSSRCEESLQLCETCMKAQDMCSTIQEDCNQKKWTPFPYPTYKPMKPNQPPKKCKKQGESCAYVGDRSCCDSFSCEEASEEGKFKCILLVNDQKPSNSGSPAPTKKP